MILNLTQHPASPEQLAEGVVNPEANKGMIKGALTFGEIPAQGEIKERAEMLAELAATTIFEMEIECHKVLIGGAPYLMGALELALKEEGLQPVYAFSERASVEITEPDGSVVKTNVFKHKGFIEV